MSTDYAELGEAQETVQCILCAGNFVPGGVRIDLPDRVCIWCFSRSSLYRRYTTLWKGLKELAEKYEPTNPIYLGAKAVIDGAL